MIDRLLALALAAVVSGCANSPTTLGKVAPRENVVAKYSASPNYDAVDKYSFAQAEILYPASGGHHSIAIGDFLIAEVFDIYKDRRVELVRLLQFKSQCDPQGTFFPHAVCGTSYTIEAKDPLRRVIEASVGPIDIGNIVVKQDQIFLLPLVVGNDQFQGQAAPLLKAISISLRAKLAPPQ